MANTLVHPVPRALGRLIRALLLNREHAEPRRHERHERDHAMRLRADIWVSAYLRRLGVEGVSGVLRRRGAAEAGAIFVKLDRLDGTAVLFGPAPQSEMRDDGIERVWTRVHKGETIDTLDAEARLRREIDFDPDVWIVEVEDRQGRSFLDLAA